VIASVGVSPFLLAFASIMDEAREQFIAAVSVVLWAGNIAAGVYYLHLLSYSNQNTVTTCNVVPGLCAGPLLIASAFSAQVALLFSRL
jgi:hypothetical protein